PLLHPRLELHERLAEPVDLLVGERAVLHPAQRLALHQLPEELDQRQHELSEALLDTFRIGVHPPREGLLDVLELARDPTEVAARREELVDGAGAHAPSAPNEYGGHGPVQTVVRSCCSPWRRRTARRQPSGLLVGT